MRFRCAWLFPGDGIPVPNAVVEVNENRIHSITNESEHPSRNIVDLGRVALIPGLINAHTHLEFSDLRAPVEPREHFADWIAGVIRQRRERTASPTEAIQQGLEESRRAGVKGIAEIATSELLLNVPPEKEGPRLLVFREILGLQPERIDSQLAVAKSFLDQSRARFTGMDAQRFSFGLSPHAPYSLHPRLFRGLIDLAVKYQVPVAMHLAESRAEMELLDSGTGPLVDLFRKMEIWPEGVLKEGLTPLDYLKELSRAPRGIVVHGNYLSDAEIRFLAACPHLSLAYCPRTHSAMQPAAPHPWRRLLDQGVNVILGTDSRASNPDLSLWRELQLLSRSATDLPASTLLSLATSRSARACGWNDCGQLTPGFQADFCIVPLSDAGNSDPERFLFETSEIMVRPSDWN